MAVLHTETALTPAYTAAFVIPEASIDEATDVASRDVPAAAAPIYYRWPLSWSIDGRLISVPCDVPAAERNSSEQTAGFE